MNNSNHQRHWTEKGTSMGAVSKIIVLYLVCCLNKVDATATLLMKFVAYDNPGGLGDNGNCCEGTIFCDPSAPSECDHYFTVCVDKYDGTFSMNSCPIGKRETDAVMDQDHITFGSMIGSTRNLMTFKFERWRYGAVIKVKIMDSDTDARGILFGNADDYVDTVLTRFATTPALQESSATWRRLTLTARTTLSIDVKVFCDAHYFGDDCATYCRDDNRGRHYDCQRRTGHKMCHRGWTGDDCDTQINECASDPCQNGGACEDRQNSFTCRCANGYQGQLCQADVNECAVSPCQNGGTCSNARGSFSCQCRLGFTGRRCESVIEDPCDPSPCNHGAACVPDPSRGFTCVCPESYSGPPSSLHEPTPSDLLPNTNGRQTAFILSGALKESPLKDITKHLKEAIADFLKTEPRDMNTTYDLRECLSENGNPISVLLVTAAQDGEIIMSDTITEMFGRMKPEEFQSLVQVPIGHVHNCSQINLFNTSEGEGSQAIYIVIGVACFLILVTFFTIFSVVVRRKKNVEIGHQDEYDDCRNPPGRNHLFSAGRVIITKQDCTADSSPQQSAHGNRYESDYMYVYDSLEDNIYAELRDTSNTVTS